MSFAQIKSLSPELFKRYCGVKPDTFVKICEFVRDELRRVQKKSGRPCKLSVEDQVLLTLEYWREYPTQFHIAKRWQLSEATVSAHHCQNREPAQKLQRLKITRQKSVA